MYVARRKIISPPKNKKTIVFVSEKKTRKGNRNDRLFPKKNNLGGAGRSIK